MNCPVRVGTLPATAVTHADSASDVRHALRTHVNHIIGYGGLLLDQVTSDLPRRDIERLVSASRELLGAIETAFERPPGTANSLGHALRSPLSTIIGYC